MEKKVQQIFQGKKNSQRDSLFLSLANSVPCWAPEEFHHSLQKAAPKGKGWGGGEEGDGGGGCALEFLLFKGKFSLGF